MSLEVSFRDLSAPQFNEILKNHNSLTFKLVNTVADFTQQLAIVQERHSEDLQILVENFRKKNAELRKDRSTFQSALFTVWELLLQEVEVDSQLHGDIARTLNRKLGTVLLERTFHRKIQSRKAFLHRESLEAILTKAEELLLKCQKEYFNAYQKVATSKSQNHLPEYYESHNSYVQQLHASNGMLKQYQNDILPMLLEELRDVYVDISDIITTSMEATTEFIANKVREQGNHYQTISNACRSVNPSLDLTSFMKTLNAERITTALRLHTFTSPALMNDTGIASNDSMYSVSSSSSLLLQNEVVIDRNARITFTKKTDSLRQEIHSLEIKIQQLEETLDSMLKLQQRSLGSNLLNKANEIQEDISMKRFDIHVANIHLAALKSQIDLFLTKQREILAENGLGMQRERKSSTGSTVSIKNKWLKAFKSLKGGTPSSNSEREDDRRLYKSGPDNSGRFNLYEGQHLFQEYTYKKVTPCDICREILRGHSRQGLKCKMCKINVHFGECQERAGKCQPKPRLLRRQKSTSEIETKTPELEDEKNQQTIDPVYQLLRAAVDARRNPSATNDSQTMTAGERWTQVMGLMPRPSRSRSNASSSGSSSSSHLLAVNMNPLHASCSAPHSPQRKKLSLRMKSFSLDESSQHSVQRGRHQTTQYAHNQSPQSPRKIVFGKTRMSSVDLPNSNEKSSASPSPCPSPKPQRLLPTNIYVVLYNFRSRHEDELDLKAGAMVTVTDTSDPDWWQGKCCGHVGYFPSKYVAKLFPGEKPLQMTHTIQVSDGENGMVKLLRDQVVIEVGEEMDGTVMVRTATNDKPISCPIKYTQEV